MGGRAPGRRVVTRMDEWLASRSEMAARNRVTLTGRLRWPEGALQACQQVEARHKHWSLWWSRKNVVPGFERPAGFTAVRDDGHYLGRALVFAETAAELEPLIEAAEERIAAAVEQERRLNAWMRR